MYNSCSTGASGNACTKPKVYVFHKLIVAYIKINHIVDHYVTGANVSL
jgi:hypothetical protein